MTTMKKVIVLFLVSLAVIFALIDSQLFTSKLHRLNIDNQDTQSQMTLVDNNVVSETDNELLALRKYIDDVQQRQNQLIKSNETLQKSIAQISKLTRQPEQQYQTDNVQKDADRVLPQDYSATAENELEYAKSFDDLWEQNTYEERDEAWAAEMETTFYDIQQQFDDIGTTSTSITDHSCGSNSCVVEFTHLGTDSVERSQFIEEVMPSAASMVSFKEINDGGAEKTIAIYLR